jgi:hypothetical protein
MSLTRPRPPGRGRFSPHHLSGGSSQLERNTQSTARRWALLEHAVCPACPITIPGYVQLGDYLANRKRLRARETTWRRRRRCPKSGRSCTVCCRTVPAGAPAGASSACFNARRCTHGSWPAPESTNPSRLIWSNCPALDTPSGLSCRVPHLAHHPVGEELLDAIRTIPHLGTDTILTPAGISLRPPSGLRSAKRQRNPGPASAPALPLL